MKKIVLTLAAMMTMSMAFANTENIPHDQFINDMRKAANAEASERAELVKKAATKELKYMHYVLNEKQYRKYNTLLNLTLENRGLLK